MEEARAIARLRHHAAAHEYRRNVRVLGPAALVELLARILVVVEEPSFSMDALRISPEEIGAAAGVQLTRVDYLLRGKGSQFAEVKRRFDAPGPEPRGMICYGEEEGMLVGTDLAHVDAVVAVGDISRHVLTQALGRVFRPRRSRDNSRLVAMVRIRVPH